MERKTWLGLLVVAILAASLFVDGFCPARAQTAGSAWTWGDNTDGELGNGDTTFTNSSVPVQPNTVTNVISLAGGQYHSLAVQQDGTVWAWGFNLHGELGNGFSGLNKSSVVPLQVVNGSGGFLMNITAVAAGGYHSLALAKDGTVWAWGFNQFGDLGNGTNGTGTDSNVPVHVTGLTNVVAIAAGASHSLALAQDGTVWAWGYNGVGALGNGDNTFTDSNVPVQVTGLTGVVAIAAGAYHSLAVKGDGTVWAWGYNADGELGNGDATFTNSTVPVQVSGLTGCTSVSAGAYHSLAVKGDGTVSTWGYNGDGELGDGTETDSNTPVQVLNIAGAVAVAGGAYSSVALLKDGTVWAWGDNSTGELGDGTTTSSDTAVEATTFDTATGWVIGIASGYSHTLALTRPFGPVQTITVTPANTSVTIGTPVTLDVVANYKDGTTRDVTSDPATVYTLTHGSGTLTANTYTSSHVESAVISIAYTSGGITAFNASYITETGTNRTVRSIAVTPYQTTVTVGTPLALSVVATYTDGSTADVTYDPATVYTLYHGVGTLTGNSYTSTRVEAAVVTVAYTAGGKTAKNVSYINEAAPARAVHAITVTPYQTSVPYGTPVNLKVVATYTDGSTADVTTDPATVYTLYHGVGTLTGHTYISTRIEAAVITVAYTSLGVTAKNVSYINETQPGHGRIISSSFTPYTTTVAFPNPVTFKFMVTYADSTVLNVSTNAATKYTIQHGVGTLTGNSYTSTRSEAAVIVATYTDPTTAQVITKASYIDEVSKVLTHLNVTPLTSSVSVGTPVTLTATATYSDGSTADVTSAATFSIQHGVGTLVGHTYTSTRVEAAVILVTYSEYTVSLQNVAYVNSH